MMGTVSRGFKHYCLRGWWMKYSVQGTLNSIVPGGSGMIGKKYSFQGILNIIVPRG